MFAFEALLQCEVYYIRTLLHSQSEHRDCLSCWSHGSHCTCSVLCQVSLVVLEDVVVNYSQMSSIAALAPQVARAKASETE